MFNEVPDEVCVLTPSSVVNHPNSDPEALISSNSSRKETHESY